MLDPAHVETFIRGQLALYPGADWFALPAEPEDYYGRIRKLMKTALRLDKEDNRPLKNGVQLLTAYEVVGALNIDRRTWIVIAQPTGPTAELSEALLWLDEVWQFSVCMIDDDWNARWVMVNLDGVLYEARPEKAGRAVGEN